MLHGQGRRGRTLTHAGYQAADGVSGASRPHGGDDTEFLPRSAGQLAHEPTAGGGQARPFQELAAVLVGDARRQLVGGGAEGQVLVRQQVRVVPEPDRQVPAPQRRGQLAACVTAVAPRPRAGLPVAWRVLAAARAGPRIAERPPVTGRAFLSLASRCEGRITDQLGFSNSETSTTVSAGRIDCSQIRGPPPSSSCQKPHPFRLSFTPGLY